MKKQAVVVFVVGAALTGCASKKVPVAELARPEVVIDTIPAGAHVSESGADRGTTPLVFRAGGENAAHSLVITHPGYHPHQMVLSDEEIGGHNGERVLVPLRPDTFESDSKPIAPDDIGQLTRAGGSLSRAARCPEALLFFRQILTLDPRTPAAHKGMGICYAKLNERRKALDAYKAYLLNAPSAPDAAKVQAMISRAEGDIDIPPPSQDD